MPKLKRPAPTERPEPLFQLGRHVMTAGAREAVDVFTAYRSLGRHVAGDWGEVGVEDARTNEIALREGLRILSSYKTMDGVKFWVITEADRTVTTILLPSEY